MLEWRHFFRRNIARNNQVAIQSADINPRVEQEVRRGRYAHRFYSQITKFQTLLKNRGRGSAGSRSSKILRTGFLSNFKLLEYG